MTHDSPSDADPPEGIKNLRKYLGLPPTDPKDPQAELSNRELKEKIIKILIEVRFTKHAADGAKEILALVQAHQQELLSEANNKVDRFEVIDDTGRAYVKGSIYGSPVGVRLDYQDDNQTLKVFVTSKIGELNG